MQYPLIMVNNDNNQDVRKLSSIYSCPSLEQEKTQNSQIFSYYIDSVQDLIQH